MFNVIIQGIALIIGGMLVIPNIVAKQNEKAGNFLTKIEPYQGSVGLLLLLWGLWDFLSFFIWMGQEIAVIKAYPVLGTIMLLSIFVEIALGFLLSVNLIKKWDKLPQDKLDKIENIIQKFQTPLGFMAILFGAYIIVAMVIIIIVGGIYSFTAL